jgi:predicted Zn-dependent peptidase
LEKLARALHRELVQVSNEGVSSEELQRAKTRIKADLIRRLKSNLGLAIKLARTEAQMGGWQQVFASLEEYEQVKTVDVRSVAGKYLVPENRTTGRLLLQKSRKGEK